MEEIEERVERLGLGFAPDEREGAEIPAGHTRFSWLQRCALHNHIPIGHTKFSWGLPEAEAGAPCQVACGPAAQVMDKVDADPHGISDYHFSDWPPSPGSTLECCVCFAVGTADWSAQGAVGEAIDCSCSASVLYGPHHFQSRKVLTLTDFDGRIALFGRRDLTSVIGECYRSPYTTWWLHVAAVGGGRLQFYLQSARSQGFLCSNDTGGVALSQIKSPACLWQMPVSAVRQVCGFPCKVFSMAYERYLALMVPRDAAPVNPSHPGQLMPILETRAPPSERLRGRPVLRTSGDRKNAAELMFNGVHASLPHVWGWCAATKEHREQGFGSAELRTDGAAQGWIMMVRHGLSVANMQKDVFKGVCDERYIDAPLSPQGRRQAEDMWRFVREYNPTLILVSPMKRALQTCLIALDPAPHAPSIVVLPVLMEGAGTGMENRGRLVEFLAADVELQCHTHWNRVDFSRVPAGVKWWEDEQRKNASGGGRRRQASDLVAWLETRPAKVREKVLVFSHWGTIEATSGRSCSNGGAMIEFVYAPFEPANKNSKRWQWTHVRKRE